MVVLIGLHPVSELLTGCLRGNLVLHTVAHKRDALHEFARLFLAFENCGTADHDLIQRAPELLGVLIFVVKLGDL